VRVGEQHVAVNLVTTEQLEAVLDLCQRPDDLTTFERSSGVHFHVTSVHEVLEEVKRFLVLNGVPVAGHHIQDLVVTGSNQGCCIDCLGLVFDLDECRDLLYSPVQTSCLHHLIGAQIAGDFVTQTMPRYFASVCHCLYHVCHLFSPLSSRK